MNIADHWWWRPGWRPGRRMYTWHVTFADVPAVRELAARAQARLAGLPGLDLVPLRWLHLTVQGVGFTDEVPGADVAAITQAARRRLAGVAAPWVKIGPARVESEGIVCWAEPLEGLTRVRDALRAAIADIWPVAAVPDPAGWAPHVSVAYSRVTGPADAYETALAGLDDTADVAVNAVRLIVLGRDEHLYQWTEYATARLLPQEDGITS